MDPTFQTEARPAVPFSVVEHGVWLCVACGNETSPPMAEGDIAFCAECLDEARQFAAAFPDAEDELGGGD